MLEAAMMRKIIRSAAQRIPRSWLDVARERTGAAAVEFALVVPVFLMILMGMIQFGITINNYIELTNAVRVGGRQFAISRSNTTPWSTARTAVTSAAMNLTAGSIAITLKVNGAACTSDATCQTALGAAAGGAASVSATYPCDLTIMGINYFPSCSLASQNTEFIE